MPEQLMRYSDAMAVHADEAARLLRSLANPNRLMVLCLLGEGEQSVGTLNGSLPLSQSALSQHLALLREADGPVLAVAIGAYQFGFDHEIACIDRGEKVQRV